MSSAPRVSVVIRSYNRLPALCGLLEQLLAQQHDSFELVVVEQSTSRPAEADAGLGELARDPRVRVLRFPPLGGPRARNRGVAAARGEVLVFIDDDDEPVGDDFLARIEARFADPRCLGLTCRHVERLDEEPSRLYRALARRRCMRFSPLLRLPWTFVRHDAPVDRVDYVHGTGGAIRRAAVERFGGWDEDAPVEDEASFGFRAVVGMEPREYFCFAPEVRLRRVLDIEGGLDKRRTRPAMFFRKHMTFVHRVLGRYHPARVVLFYPLYVSTAWWWTVQSLWTEHQHHTTLPARLGATAVFTLLLPLHTAKMATVPIDVRQTGAARTVHTT